MQKLRIQNKREVMSAFTLLTQVGVTMLTTIVLMLFLGKFLDEKLGTTPWLLFICILLGIAAAFRNLYVMTREFWGQNQRK